MEKNEWVSLLPRLSGYCADRYEIRNTMRAVAPVGKRTYSVDEVREILSISRRKAYELCNSDCFKVIWVGRSLRVSKASVDYWLDHDEQIGGQ